MQKPWFKSVTVMSAVVFAVIQTLEQQGFVPAGGAQVFADLGQNVLVALGVFGLRRAVG